MLENKIGGNMLKKQHAWGQDGVLLHHGTVQAWGKHLQISLLIVAGLCDEGIGLAH